MKKDKQPINIGPNFKPQGLEDHVVPGVPEEVFTLKCSLVSTKTSECNKLCFKHNLHNLPMIYFACYFND